MHSLNNSFLQRSRNLKITIQLIFCQFFDGDANRSDFMFELLTSSGVGRYKPKTS